MFIKILPNETPPESNNLSTCTSHAHPDASRLPALFGAIPAHHMGKLVVELRALLELEDPHQAAQGQTFPPEERTTVVT